MKEIWKNITDYPNYKINNNGEIINIKTNKKIKNFKGNDGYIRIYLFKNSKKKGFLVHRLVAQAFIPNPKNFKEVNHKDEDKQNNNINNLEWCEHRYNCNYGTMQKRKAKGCCKRIKQYDLNGNFIKEWNSIKEAGETLKIHRGNISWCCKGKYKSTKGYIFEYQYPNLTIKEL